MTKVISYQIFSQGREKISGLSNSYNKIILFLFWLLTIFSLKYKTNIFCNFPGHEYLEREYIKKIKIKAFFFIAEIPYKFVECALNWVWNILSVMIWDMKLWFHLNIQNWCVNWDGSSKVYQTLPIIQLCYMNLYFTSQNKVKLFTFFGLAI